MSFVRLDQTMMCFATYLIMTCLFLQINKDDGTVFYRQFNCLVSFFNYMLSYKINRTNISKIVEILEKLTLLTQPVFADLVH